MAGVPRAPDIIEAIRSLQEQVRELRVRTRESNRLEPWISASALLNVGWSTEADESNGLHARYYRHAGRVEWGGTIEFVGGAGAQPSLPLLLAPVGYRPDRLVNAAFVFDEDVSHGHLTGDWLPLGIGGAMVQLDTNPSLGDALILDNLSYRHA